jgi:hypothetical protein
LEHFTAFWSILWPFGIFPRFGILCQEKSGNPACEHHLDAITVPQQVQPAQDSGSAASSSASNESKLPPEVIAKAQKYCK